MTLQNRVRPDGSLVSQPWRGMFMGNRGGRIHDPQTRTLVRRRWASKRWITCVTRFKQRQRTVMGPGYTELFFLDEVCALAAGHRPCFECRRQDALRFSQVWAKVTGTQCNADAMDDVLHEQRLKAGTTLNREDISILPDGAFFRSGEKILTQRDGKFLAWDGSGYQQADCEASEVILITPPVIVEILKAGYQPVWHEHTHPQVSRLGSS